MAAPEATRRPGDEPAKRSLPCREMKSCLKKAKESCAPAQRSVKFDLPDEDVSHCCVLDGGTHPTWRTQGVTALNLRKLRTHDELHGCSRVRTVASVWHTDLSMAFELDVRDVIDAYA